ncbi:hypothetical protein SDD30_07870 [Moorella naiadis]|uniref:outer membrane protein assembly factor BamB family protein n=1 Tax=Moorella naiadis (nom. illeg.) TaxID=3093670 RepID=UPI003D9C95EF
MLLPLLFSLVAAGLILSGQTVAAASRVPVEGWFFTPGKGEARWVTGTRDGGYVLTGWIETGEEGAEVFLARLDRKGNELWQKTFKGNGYSCGYCVQEVREGGFIVVGDTKSPKGYDHDVYVVRTDERGELLWERNFGGQYCDYAWSVQQTKDGSFILAGGTESFGAGIYDVYLIKLDSSGQKLWEKTYGGKGSDCGYAVLEVDDGGYLIAGNTESFGNGNPDIYLLRTDGSGQLLWQKTYGGKGSNYAWSLTTSRDGGYMIAGEKEVAGRQGNILAACLIKVDHEGNDLWEKTYGAESAGAFHAVCRARDGGYVLAGKKESNGGGYDIYLVKTNKNGDPLWEKTIPGFGFNCGYSIVLANGGGYVLAGRKGVEKSSRSDIFLLQLKENERMQPPLTLYAGIIVAMLVVGLILRKW